MQWRRAPPPDPSVTILADAASQAAHAGQIRVMGVVTINPLLKVEFAFAGELDDVKKDLLIGGLTRLINKLSE